MFRCCLLVVTSLILTTGAYAADPHAAPWVVPDSRQKLPKDVASFVERRDTCDHYRSGELGPLPSKRPNHSPRGSKKYCSGIDAQQKRLFDKYSQNAELRQLITASP